MANIKTFVAALGLAGATLMPASAAFAQQYVSQVPVEPVLVVDCYYGDASRCGPNTYGNGYAAYGAYSAYGAVGGGPYAAIGLAAPAYYAAPNPYGWGRLSPTDLVAIYGNGR